VKYEAFGRAKTEAPTMVLSAGLGGLGAFWQPQFAMLSERFHVIAYDHRGTGANKSALPEGYSIAAMADDVVGILDEAGVGHCHFMGHALGGLIGMELAVRHPSRVSGLVLVNAWPTVSSHGSPCSNDPVSKLTLRPSRSFCIRRPGSCGMKTASSAKSRTASSISRAQKI
jgi:aminoacrylate hydrolase